MNTASKILAINIALATLLFSPNPAIAAQDPGTFSCTWQDGQCTLKKEKCGRDLFPDTEALVCPSITNEAFCNAQDSLPCETRPSGEDKTAPPNTFNCYWQWADFWPFDNDGRCEAPQSDNKPENNCGRKLRPNETNSCTATNETDCVAIQLSCDTASPDILSGGPSGRAAITTYECPSLDNNPGLLTALGCLSYYPAPFIRQVLPWSVRLAGGVAFFLILLAAFQYTTSTGDPEKIKAAQELLTSAISGLLIILFASVLLYTLGVDVFGLTTLGF